MEAHEAMRRAKFQEAQAKFREMVSMQYRLGIKHDICLGPYLKVQKIPSALHMSYFVPGKIRDICNDCRRRHPIEHCLFYKQFMHKFGRQYRSCAELKLLNRLGWQRAMKRKKSHVILTKYESLEELIRCCAVNMKSSESKPAKTKNLQSSKKLKKQQQSSKSSNVALCEETSNAAVSAGTTESSGDNSLTSSDLESNLSVPVLPAPINSTIHPSPLSKTSCLKTSHNALLLHCADPLIGGDRSIKMGSYNLPNASPILAPYPSWEPPTSPEPSLGFMPFFIGSPTMDI